jgi:ankyrin repeat protein
LAFEWDEERRDPFGINTKPPELDPYQVRLIMNAVYHEPDAAQVERLLAESPSLVHARSERHSYTPLHLAVFKDHVEIAKLLLAHDADVDARCSHETCTNESKTPLHFAVQQPSADMVALLLEHGADPNATVVAHGEDTGVSALDLATGDSRQVVPYDDRQRAELDAISGLLKEAGATPGRTHRHGRQTPRPDTRVQSDAASP